MNVMQVISNLEVGGAQEVVRTLAEHLAAAGCRTVVCAFGDGPLRQDIERLGLPVELIPDRRSSVVDLPGFLGEMARIRRELNALIDRYEIDVIQTHLLTTLNFLLLTLRPGRPLQIYWTFQNARFVLREEHLGKRKILLRPKRLAHRLLYRWGGRRVDGLIAVAEDVKTSIQAHIGGIPEAKIPVIFNSVDFRRYQIDVDRAAVRGRLGLRPTDQLLAVVATFKEQKGHRYLLEAAALLGERRPDLHLLLIGDGELRTALEERTRVLGLAERVHFLGTRRDVPELLAASDGFVLPSLWEGLSVALVEAMAGALPVVATRVSGTNQVMVDGETGWLVPPADPAALAAAIEALLADPKEAAARGDRARRRVEKLFSAQKQARDHLALFEQAMGTNGREPAQPLRRTFHES